MVPQNLSTFFSSSPGIDNFRIQFANQNGEWTLETGQPMKQTLSRGQTEEYRFISLTQGMVLDLLVFSGRVSIEVSSPA